jgi:hypothetical protein
MIRFSGVEGVPTDYEVRLINLSNTVPVDLRKTKEYSYRSAEEVTRFKLVIGKRQFVENELASFVPQKFELLQNYPNPFNPSTQIRFDLADASEVRLVVFNLLGQKVRTLVAANMPAGAHHIAWDGRDDRGLDVSTGLYLYKLQAASFVSCRKMLLTR